VDLVAHDLQIDRLLVAGALHADADERALLTAQLRDRLFAGPAFRVLPFNPGDHVPAADTLLIRWRCLEDVGDRDVAVNDVDGDAQAVIAALLAFPHLRVGLRIEETGVRVERLQHAADGAVDETVRVDLARARVFRLDRRERRRKDLVLIRNPILGDQGTMAVEAANQRADENDEHRR